MKLETIPCTCSTEAVNSSTWKFHVLFNCAFKIISRRSICILRERHWQPAAVRPQPAPAVCLSLTGSTVVPILCYNKRDMRWNMRIFKCRFETHQDIIHFVYVTHNNGLQRVLKYIESYILQFQFQYYYYVFENLSVCMLYFPELCRLDGNKLHCDEKKNWK